MNDKPSMTHCMIPVFVLTRLEDLHADGTEKLKILMMPNLHQTGCFVLLDYRCKTR